MSTLRPNFGRVPTGIDKDTTNFLRRVKERSQVETDFGVSLLSAANAAAARTLIGVAPSGVIQTVNMQDGALATGTTIMPVDDTIPQSNEGDEYMALAITPESVDNLLRIDVVVIGSISAPGLIADVALFQDSTANALAAAWASRPTSIVVLDISFTHWMTASTTSETTFKVRVGPHTTGTFEFNGATTRYFGGTMASSMTITEYAP